MTDIAEIRPSEAWVTPWLLRFGTGSLANRPDWEPKHEYIRLGSFQLIKRMGVIGDCRGHGTRHQGNGAPRVRSTITIDVETPRTRGFGARSHVGTDAAAAPEDLLMPALHGRSGFPWTETSCGNLSGDTPLQQVNFYLMTATPGRQPGARSESDRLQKKGQQPARGTTLVLLGTTARRQSRGQSIYH